MALRRYGEELQKKSIIKDQFKLSREIIMKTNLCDICIVKTLSALDKIKQIHQIVDYEKGETLNVIQGNYEITIVIPQKYLDSLKEILNGEKILNIQKHLVSLTIGLSKEFLSTPGVLALATRKLAWNNINIFENISTMTELIFIVAEKDAVKAYNTFQEMIKEHIEYPTGIANIGSKRSISNRRRLQIDALSVIGATLPERSHAVASKSTL